ncbi:hypothetical protein LF1_41700 [Rubripirellula obstinata]|uniref:Uncharacterized protein n=1 Tax=Rubripirellula obstinata TaxID=406547 RepID=A0A5B1CP48_9BACT|nr:hypothetical protein LF1_41700 [Rubripirellula obstinata]
MVFAALIVVSILFVIRSLAPQTIGETVRRNVLAQLQLHYSDHHVSIRRGNFDPARGLVLEGLLIEQKAGVVGSGRRPLVRIDRLTVMGSFNAERLKTKQNPIQTERVVLEGVHAEAWIKPNGKVSLESLMPLPVLGPAAPRMDLRDVTIQLHGAPDQRPIKAELSDVVIINRTSVDGNCNKEITLRGSAEFANQITAKISTKNGATDFRVMASGGRFDRGLFDRLPTPWANKIRDARMLRCVGDVGLAVFQDPSGHVNFRMTTNVHDGQFSHPSIPYPITGLSGKIVCDPGGMTIEASQAKLGDAVVRIRGKTAGYRFPCDVDLKVETVGLMLNDRIAKALPAKLREGWEKIQPIGRIDIDADVTCRQAKWRTEGELICKGVDVRYEKFPYPIEQLVGRIKVTHGFLITDDLSGRIAGNQMQCLFRMPIRPDLTHEKSFAIATDGPVPIDRTLLRSLSPLGSTSAGAMEQFVRSLNPSGSIRLASATFATDANNVKSRQIDLRVVDGRLTYEKFAYPLYNVAGTIEVKDDLVRLKGFRATNANAGVIQCSGEYRLPSLANSQNTSALQPAPQLALRFQAAGVPMDESLRQSLPAQTRQVWDTLSPSGVLDKLDVLVIKQDPKTPLGLDVKAHQLGHGQVTNRVLSLKPPSIPYRIDLTEGSVHFDGSQVMIQSIRGSHDASRMFADGSCIEGPDGRWVLSLDLHGGSRLHPDAELIASLPGEMREAMRRLQLRGPVSIRGNTQIALPSEYVPTTDVDWDLALQLEGNRIGDVGPVHSLRGEVLVKGHRDETTLRADGQVKLDSMHAYDLQITGVRGPFSIVDDRLTLGEQASRQTIRGNMFGGAIDLDGDLVFSSGNFDVQLAMSDGQMPTLLAEFGHSDQEMTGTFGGQIQLQGNLSTTDLLKGTGAAEVSGANLYKLPFLVQVLNLLRISASEDYAFTDGQVEFTLFGDSLTFSDMQLWGDLVSLQGGGTLDRRNELDLTFNTRVSPKNSFTQVFRPLKSRRYTLWTIDVNGPISNPHVERRALDGVSQTLGRWFPGMNRESDPSQVRSAGATSEPRLRR